MINPAYTLCAKCRLPLYSHSRIGIHCTLGTCDMNGLEMFHPENIFQATTEIATAQKDSALVLSLFQELQKAENAQSPTHTKTTAQLRPKVEDLYYRLGGIGNPDARLVRVLMERLEKAENAPVNHYQRELDLGRPPGM